MMVNRISKNSILIVVLFALIGYSLAYFAINCSLIQYSKLPNYLIVKVKNGLGSDSIEVKYPVVSLYPLDTFSAKIDTTNKAIKDTSLLKKNASPTEEKITIKTNHTIYHDNHSFLIWTILICIMATISSGACPLFIGQIFILKNKFSLNNKSIQWAFLCPALLYITLVATYCYRPGYYGPEKIIDDFHILLSNGFIVQLIVLFTLLLSLPILVVMFLVAPSSTNIMEKIKDVTDIEKAARNLEYLNQVLLQGLRFFTIIVVLAVLTSAALGLSIKTTFSVLPYDIFPDKGSIVYGLYFSLFLGMVYLPLYYYLLHQNERLKQSISELETGRNECEVMVAKILHIENSGLDNLRLTLTMLTPFISAVLPSTLQFF